MSRLLWKSKSKANHEDRTWLLTSSTWKIQFDNFLCFWLSNKGFFEGKKEDDEERKQNYRSGSEVATRRHCSTLPDRCSEIKRRPGNMLVILLQSSDAPADMSDVKEILSLVEGQLSAVCIAKIAATATTFNKTQSESCRYCISPRTGLNWSSERRASYQSRSR